MKRKHRKQLVGVKRPLTAYQTKEGWALDLVSDTIVGGQHIRVLALGMDTSFCRQSVTRMLDRFVSEPASLLQNRREYTQPSKSI